MIRSIAGLIVISLLLPMVVAQQVPAPPVPRLIRFGGTIQNPDGSARTGVVGVTFSLYSDQKGSAALWTELQNVTADANAQYTVLLGSQHIDGVPADLFTTNEARWLGVQIAGEPEQPRVLLVSVPYALKAGDADTLDGLSLQQILAAGTVASLPSTSVRLSAADTNLVLGRPIRSEGPSSTPPTNGGPEVELRLDATPSAVLQAMDTSNNIPLLLLLNPLGGNVGIGTANPASRLTVAGLIQSTSGGFKFPDGSIQTAAAGSGSGNGIGAVTAGDGLTGGGSSSTVSLAVDGSVARTNAANSFTAGQNIAGNLSVSGNVAAGTLTGNGSGITNLNPNNLAGTLPTSALTGTYSINISGNAATAASAVTAGAATSFTGSLGGDVTGSQGATLIGKLQGMPVSAASPSSGQFLFFNGTNWQPTTVSGSALPYVNRDAVDTSTASIATSGGQLYAFTQSNDAAATADRAVLKLADKTSNPGSHDFLIIGQTPGTFSVSSSGAVTATSFIGNGAGLTGVSAATLPATYTNQVSFSNAGNSFTGTFSGSGSSLSALNANNLSSGTVAASRLSGTYAIDIAGNAATATNFAGILAGEVTGTQSATIVANAVPANTANAIVRRDGSGNFDAGTISLGGNLALPSTASASAGSVTFGGTSFLHGFGSNNTFVGEGAGNFALTGTDNTAAGRSALRAVTTGKGNTAVGSSAGETSTAANAITTGSYNTFVGYNAGPGTAIQLTNATAIGANALVSASNALVLGDATVNVGIGVPAPAHKLSVAGVVESTTGGIMFPDGTTQTSAGISTASVTSGLTSSVSGGTLSIGLTQSCATNQVLAWSGSAWVCESVSAPISITAGPGLTGGTITSVGTVAVDATKIPFLNTANAFTASTTNYVLGGTQTGAGAGTLNAATLPTAVRGDSTTTSNYSSGVLGTSSSSYGFGIVGENLANSSSTNDFAIGVFGVSTQSTLGTGVWGEAEASTGTTVGVFGRAFSGGGVNTAGGTGVIGYASAASGDAVGVYGSSSSTSGTGVWGDTSAVTSGPTYGVFGSIGSGDASASAGVFDNVTSAAGNILIGRAGITRTRVFRVDTNGKGYFNGGTQMGGADFAESFEVAGERKHYEPGDVLVIDTAENRRLTLARQPYSSLVAGIYSTKPGVLASPHKIGDPSIENEVPLAVVGVVPCKVTTENGPIHRGDLLVSSSTPGHAMKGTDRSRMLGAVIGKALEPLESGEGVVQVLVSLQ